MLGGQIPICRADYEYNGYLKYDNSKSLENLKYINNRSFNAIALVSTLSEEDHQEIQAQGISVSQISPFSVNNKKFNIFWAFGPQGEIVEVVSHVKIPKKTK